MQNLLNTGEKGLRPLETKKAHTAEGEDLVPPADWLPPAVNQTQTRGWGHEGVFGLKDLFAVGRTGLPRIQSRQH